MALGVGDVADSNQGTIKIGGTDKVDDEGENTCKREQKEKISETYNEQPKYFSHDGESNGLAKKEKNTAVTDSSEVGRRGTEPQSNTARYGNSRGKTDQNMALGVRDSNQGTAQNYQPVEETNLSRTVKVDYEEEFPCIDINKSKQGKALQPRGRYSGEKNEKNSDPAVLPEQKSQQLRGNYSGHDGESNGLAEKENITAATYSSVVGRRGTEPQSNTARYGNSRDAKGFPPKYTVIVGDNFAKKHILQATIKTDKQVFIKNMPVGRERNSFIIAKNTVTDIKAAILDATREEIEAGMMKTIGRGPGGNDRKGVTIEDNSLMIANVTREPPELKFYQTSFTIGIKEDGDNYEICHFQGYDIKNEVCVED